VIGPRGAPLKQPIREIGRRAVKLIIEGKPARETVAVELVVRGSTAPPQRRRLLRAAPA
jgi:DNA-binding LacI/PurR family transcriptional regulator